MMRHIKQAKQVKDGDPCPNCCGSGKLYVMQHETYTGGKLTYESKPWVECESCHEITKYEGVSHEDHRPN